MSKQVSEAPAHTVLVERAKDTSVKPALIQNGNSGDSFTKGGAEAPKTI